MTPTNDRSIPRSREGRSPLRSLAIAIATCVAPSAIAAAVLLPGPSALRAEEARPQASASAGDAVARATSAIRGTSASAIAGSAAPSAEAALAQDLDAAKGVVTSPRGRGTLTHPGVVAGVTAAFRELSFPTPDRGVVRVAYSVDFAPPSDCVAGPDPASALERKQTRTSARPNQPPTT